MQYSTLESIKEIIPSMLPKQILNEMYSKAGELSQMSSSGEVQNLHQIDNKNCYFGYHS